MAKKHLIKLLFLFTLTSFSQTQFWSDTFEDVGAPSSGTRNPSVNNSSGGPPATRYFWRCGTSDISTVNVYSGFQGVKFFAGEDHRLSPIVQSGAQNILWPSINISGKTGLSFKGLLASGNGAGNSWDTPPNSPIADYIIIEYRIDGGVWTDGLRFFASSPTISTPLSLETTGDSIGEGLVILNSPVFSEFSFNIPTTGTLLDLRLKVHSNSTSEEWAADNFRLYEVTCLSPTLNLVGQTNVLCNGASNGSATVTANGGAPFTYTWSPSGGNAATASGLSAGVYTCVTTNSCGLTASRTVTITQPASAVSTSTGVTNVLCNGGSTGSATVTASGGTPGYTYLWSTTQTTSVITGLNAGVRTVTVTDANGCTSIKSITINQPATAVSTSTSVTNVLCFGGSNGSATVTASGGTPGYTYLWSTAQTTSVISGLNAGVRTVTVTDANGCTNIKSITITQPATAVSTSTAVTNVLCNGGNSGSATITASGGTGPYSYLWSTAATTSVISSQTSGIKTVTVTDANGCTSVNSVNITQPALAITTTTGATNVLCFGGSNGSATVTATGGTPGYTYLWNSSQTTSVITGLNAGVRTVTVTDANGCTSIKSISISQPATAVSSSTTVINVLCNGGSTGSATVTASGGTAGYTYLWSTAATTSVITGQTSGVKTVTVTDVNGCTSVNSVNITQPATAVTSSTALTNISCNGGSNGSATVTASGGTAGYTYQWSTAATTSVITGQTSGVKTVTVTDANGCITVNSVNITQPTAITATQSQTNITCNGSSNGLANVNASGGTGSLTYSWSPSGGTLATASGLSAGNYTCTITDANSCSIVKAFTITQPSIITASVILTASPGCSLSNGSITVLASGGTGSLSYSWSPSGGTSSTTSGIPAGSYTCTITDVNSCSINISQSLSNPNSPSVNATTSNAGCAGQTNGSITLNVTGGNPGYTYSWSPSVSTNSLATSLGAGVYNATVTDASNCTSSQSYTLTAFPLPTVIANNSNPVLCSGGSVTLNGSGASTYTWSGSVTDNVAFTPTATSSYTVTGTDGNGCTNTAITSVSVNALPSISTITTDTILCTGQTATLSAGGAATYTWNPGGAGTSIAISPTVTTVYTVTGTDANGCVNSSMITQTVSACTGLSELEFTNGDLIVYPNPSSGILTVITKINSPITIYNIVGELILESDSKTETTVIDLNQQANGIYFVRIGAITKKIIKQ